MCLSTLAGVLTAAALFVSAAAPSAASAAPAGPAAASVEARHPAFREDHVRNGAQFQKVLDDIVASGAPGVIAEVRDADGVWTGRSGKGRLGRDEPPRADGMFRVGSVTKTFVATTVLQLVAEGRLNLDDPVERHLPGLVPNGEKITVRHVLSHRSGLFNYTDSLWPGGLQGMYDTRFKRYTPRELVAEANRHEPAFAPGTAGGYSNTNYVVLGMLIEKSTGNTARREIVERIVKPLRLRRTSFPATSTGIPGPHAHAYMRLHGSDSPYVDVTESGMSWAWTAGAMISTTHDLNTFFKALIGGYLLPGRLMREMKEARTLGVGEPYGLGIARLENPLFGTAYGHTGGTPGFTTHAFTLADGSRQVTVSINSMADTEKEHIAGGKALKALLSMDMQVVRAGFRDERRFRGPAGVAAFAKGLPRRAGQRPAAGLASPAAA
ncbi:serine hydrolase domain-containing protein [Nonomuraea mangrovi]|uniref:Serine hydrolase domain-containing protein n=1 Tax=Nonomuraea mangrovi TaxID=2316207 RepID=A0ABW4SZU7_9ACTN